MTVCSTVAGRGQELRSIADSLRDDACQGVLIVGEAGVGKTRLADEAAAEAATAGWTVHSIAATATGQSIPLAAFGEWAGRVQGHPHNAVHQVIAALTASAAPGRLLVSVDDAHLLDDMSAFIVHTLIQRRKAKVLITLRAGAPAPDAVTRPWKDGVLRRVDLSPLSESESNELIRNALHGQVSEACAEELWDLTRGNPLFLTHLIGQERAAGNLAEVGNIWRLRTSVTVSPSLLDLAQMQFDALSESAQDAVDLAAVAESIDRSLLISLTDQDASAEAERRGLIRADDDSPDIVRVSHPIYARIRLAQCGPLRQRRLRGRVATAMISPDNTAAVEPAQLGRLWLESDLPPDPQVLTHAAEVAAAQLDIEFAEKCARVAVDAGGGIAARLQHAYTLFLLGKGPDAQEELGQIRPNELRGADFLNTFNLMAMNLQFGFAQPEESLRLVEEALQGSSGVRAHQLNTLCGFQLSFTANPRRAMEVLYRVDPRELDSYGAVVCLGMRTLAHGELGDVEGTRREGAECWRILDDSQDAFNVANLAKLHTHVLVLSGHLSEAADVAAHAHRRCLGTAPIARRLCSAAIGAVALAQGDLATARYRLNPGQLDLGQFGLIMGHSYRFQIHYATALARSGDTENVIQAMERATEVRRPHLLYMEPNYLLARAWVAAVQGRIAAARDIASQAAEFAREHGQLAGEVMCLQTATQFCDTTVADRLAELSTLVQGPRAPIAARYARALADDDAVELESVSSDFESMGDVLAAADAAAHASAIHRAADRRGSALTAGARADVLSRRCGNATSPALAGAKLTFPFSHRQREIAMLIGKGLTNREIGDALALSVRTVEGHIYRATFKAGIASRAELAKLVQQLES